MSATITEDSLSTQPAEETIAGMDPYTFMAVLGKRIIHPGGRVSTETLFEQAAFQPDHRVLDVGCGVATTAIAIARRYGAQVTAVDISPLMLERATANVSEAGLSHRIEVREGDILSLEFDDDSFDRVIAEAVTMFVDRAQAARELVRVCRPGGHVLTTEFLWRKPPTEEAREVFLGEVCPGLYFDTMKDWVQIYENAGLQNVKVESGPFEMMTPRGFLHDEGLVNSVRIMLRAFRRLSYLKKLIWLMPRINRAVPYLGYITVCGTKATATS